MFRRPARADDLTATGDCAGVVVAILGLLL